MSRRIVIPAPVIIPDVAAMEAMIADTAALRAINREIRESMAEWDKQIETALKEMEA